jgi:hypothetical protein
MNLKKKHFHTQQVGAPNISMPYAKGQGHTDLIANLVSTFSPNASLFAITMSFFRFVQMNIK